MLKYQNWYAGIWIAVLGLYSFGWSSFDDSLSPALLIFFVITISLSVALGVLSSAIPLRQLKWVKKRKPVITIAVVLGFFADWGYRGSLPILQDYQGYDPTKVTDDLSVGIPYFHVVLISFAVFYAMYISYLLISDFSKKGYLVELIVLLGIFVLNNSRGYVVFCLFVLFLMYAAFNGKRIKNIKIGVIALLIVAFFAIVFFISAMGNIRSGYSWNDCSYVEMIGRFSNYPKWLPKHFMWTYLYMTSPLSNLNLNYISYSGNTDLTSVFLSFLPEQFSNGYLSTHISMSYVATYLNAVSGFATFVRAAGVVGIYIAFAGLIVYFEIVRLILCKFQVFETFGNVLLCFMSLSMIFFNCFMTSAVCYIPLFLICGSFYLRNQYKRGYLHVLEYSSL